MSIQSLLAALNPWWGDPRNLPSPPPRRRDAFERLRSILSGPEPLRAQLLLGPRQVGKTTLLLQLARAFLEGGWPPANVVFFDFSDDRCAPDVGLRDVLDHRPVDFRPDLPRLILLDELTRSPRWDLALKALVDAMRRQAPSVRDRVLVSDSAASLLRGGAADSLQGRVDALAIHGLMFREVLRLLAFEDEAGADVMLRVPGVFERYLAAGGFPERVAAEDYVATWRRLREDIADRAIARDLAREGVDVERVRVLYGYLAQASGSVFEASKRAADLQSAGEKGPDARTVRKWVELLENAFLLAPLTPWLPKRGSRDAKASALLGGRRKLYVEDHGVIPAFSPLPKPLTDSALMGRIVETAVFTHLRDFVEHRSDVHLHYFRQDRRGEIDFVLDFQDSTLGVEVTAGPGGAQKLEGARRAAELAGLDRLMLVHGGGVSLGRGEKWRSVALRDFLIDPGTHILEALP